MAGPRGFEPRTTGLEGQNAWRSAPSVYPSDDVKPSDFKGGKIRKPPKRDFQAWLSRKVTLKTLKQLMSYFDKLPDEFAFKDIPRLVKNKWYANVLRKIAQYLWEVRQLSLEDRERVFALVKGSVPKKVRQAKAPEVSMREVVESLRKIKREDYRMVYLIMAYSGARLEEACYVLNKRGDFKAVRLGDAVRLHVAYNRGRKRCEYLWLPYSLYLEIRNRKWDVYSKNVTGYAKKFGIIWPKLVRKAHYQFMEDLEIPKDVRDFIQNRYSGLDTSGESYSKIRARADKTYQKTILPKLREVVGDALQV